MGVVAAAGSLDLKTRRDHHPIDIHRQGTQSKPRQDLRHHCGIERYQVLNAFHREAFEPATHGARRRPLPHPSKASQQRIGGQVLQMLKPPAAYDQQPYQYPHHRDHAEIPADASLGKCRADQAAEAHTAQIPIEQFQPGVGGELRVGELEGKIPIDTSTQFGVSSPHSRWPFVCGRRFWVAPCFQPQRKAFFNSGPRTPQENCRIRVNNWYCSKPSHRCARSLRLGVSGFPWRLTRARFLPRVSCLPVTRSR